jgi:hypothetical protein
MRLQSRFWSRWCNLKPYPGMKGSNSKDAPLYMAIGRDSSISQWLLRGGLSTSPYGSFHMVSECLYNRATSFPQREWFHKAGRKESILLCWPSLRCYDSHILPGSQRSLTQKGSGQEWTRQDTQRVSLTQEGNDKTHIERARRLMTNWQKFYFSQQALYKRARDLNIKTLWPSYNLSVFAILYCLLPVSLTKYKLLFSQGKPFSVPSHHDRGMVHLQIPTLSECC